MIGRVALLVTFKKAKPKPQSLSRSHIRDWHQFEELMKPTLLFVLIVLLGSCELTSNKTTEPNEEAKHSEKNQIDERLIGEWGIYAHIVNEAGWNCNVCPRIVFDGSNMATLTLPSGDKEVYEWSRSANKLKIIFAGDNKAESYLIDSQYEMKFDQQEKFIELVLSLPENEQYILRK